MIFHCAAEDIERVNRIMRDPFDSDDVRFFIYVEPVASDDGLFTHRGEYVACRGCQPDLPTWDSTWRHAHLAVEGAHGGVRCEPLRVTRIAQDYLSRWCADALGLLVESGLLFPDDED